MRLLFLAPQPFFQERGTPIAVRLALQVLATRKKSKIDLLTYHEGLPVQIENVQIHRINAPAFLNGVGPGISIKKMLCDMLFLFKTLHLVWQRRNNQYNLVHAVEESVFIALLLRALFGIPYIYDMDSSLAMQVTEKWYALRPLRPVLEWCERLAVRHSTAVVPVCDALAVIAERHGSSDTHILRDVSLLQEHPPVVPTPLREEIGAGQDDKLVVYIGNLESYQGIDLLLEGFAEIAAQHRTSRVVIIGGRAEHIELYQNKAHELGVGDRVHLLGPRPLTLLDNYILQADVLVSPRTQGNNTPMKIYSYLHSGKPILATNLPTHTQVMNTEVAELREPSRQEFGAGLLRLLSDPHRSSSVGAAARALAEREYTFPVFRERLNHIYDRVGEQIDLADPIVQHS